ncbi:MAG: TlpA family protein disulfide reductase [Planctomycetaceae bacterium]|nr:TlpA family protein disulfide reductase [Planctomycetaceae bacterium]
MLKPVAHPSHQSGTAWDVDSQTTRHLFTGLLTLGIMAVSAWSVSGAEVVTEATFEGTLQQPTAGADGAIIRRFDVQLYSTANQDFFVLHDAPQEGCPWPESFGVLSANETSAANPHLIYRYEDVDYPLPLPPLRLGLPADIAVDSTWTQDGWQLTALEQRTIDSTGCWAIQARERRGRRQSLFVDARTGLLVRAQADVFMGRGDQFRLTLDRTALQSLSPDISDRVLSTFQELMTLQSALQRRSDTSRPDLSTRQLDESLAREATLTQAAQGTPLQSLVSTISGDLQQQKKRRMATENRAGQLVSKSGPEFSLSLIDGSILDSAGLKGKTIVLHFWDYRDQPLSEPYGQTGYLEFLSSRAAGEKVQVIGVATSPDFHSPENAGRARRSARKLREFMNLKYPIGSDDGSLLRALGDPRDHDGQLPLWVVLGPDGRIAHYHAGFYEIDSVQGLKELDNVIRQTSGQKQ